ncbi:MAG: hypothetical protein LC640_02545, partial [Frankia sp.]|nr:hypothetical protein [Frankia sp.]
MAVTTLAPTAFDAVQRRLPYADRLPALEQRYLFSLLLLQNPARRVAYISSAVTPPYLIDYYLRLLPGLDSDEIRNRILVVSVGDMGAAPLSKKLLARPDIVAAIREFVGDRLAMIEAFNVTELEEEVAVRIGAPIYGAAARLWPLGTKRGSRRLFAEAGIAHPPGHELLSLDDCAASISKMRAANPTLSAVVVKLDDSGAGDGNAVIDLHGLPDAGTADEMDAIGVRLQALPGWYVQTLTEGGIVEERVDGDDFRSPSVQLSITPYGDVNVLSTHDQILGGHQGQVYLGCT